MSPAFCLPEMMEHLMQAQDWFSVNYAEAREKFLGAAGFSGAGLTSFRNPHVRGPQGEVLFTDVAYFGPEDAHSILLTCSATHGVEGFCGSGAQIGTFRSGIINQLPSGVAVVAVHAINPYGFAWQRRVTEDNVDLNRNCIDHDKGHPKNSAYDDIHRFLLPLDWVGPKRDAADKGLDDYIATKGLSAFQAAVSGGQYDHADGMFYGGRKATWSNQTLHAIFERFLRNRKRVAFLDYHTGLGPSGFGELISTHPSGSEGHRRTQAWYGQVTSTDDGSSTSAPIQGYITIAMERALPGVEITSVAVEYGTLSVMEVLGAVRADNWLHLKGDVNSAQGLAIKNQIRGAFYVETPLWKQQIWHRAAEVTGKALKALGN